jgi:peroxiredoxin
MALKIGQMAPDFTLPDHLGRTIRLSNYRGQRNVVIAFFPLAWTPV